MPGTGLKNVKVMGDDLAYSKKIFEKLFESSKTMPRFKHSVSTSKDRFKNRAFSKQATFTESAKSFFSAKTNYQVILRELLEKESKGSLSHVANFSFLVNASHEAVRAKSSSPLNFMASGQNLVTPADYWQQPVHRLLVEEHVIAFVWSPTLSDSYHAVMAAVALAKLAGAVVSTVATLGAAAPALISSLQSAADVANDIIKLKSVVSEAVSHLQTVKGDLENTAKHLAHAKEHLSALGGEGEPGSEHLTGSKGMLDFTATSITQTPKKVSRFHGLLGTRLQTDDEAAKDARVKLAAADSKIQKLNFIVIQQITPLVQLSDNVEVTSTNTDVMTFNKKIYMAKKALVRVGETNRDRFNQMVAGAKASAIGQKGLTELFLRPWAVEGTYLQFLRHATETEPGSTPFTGGSIPFIDWDCFTKNNAAPDWVRFWELIDEKPSTRPIHPSILAVRAKQEAQVRAQVAAAAARTQRLHGLAHLARKNVAADRLQKVNQVLIRTQLPILRDFVLQTTTRMGPFSNSRNNPKLLEIDNALKGWEKAKIAGSSPDDVLRMKAALLLVQLNCENFIHSKVRASRNILGHLSERIAPVDRLRQLAIKIHDALP